MHRVVLLLVGLLALASVAVASSGGTTQAQPHWVIRDLGTLGKGKFFAVHGFSAAYAINDQEQIVGWSWRTDDEPWGGGGHAFLWEDGKMRDLGALPGLPYSYAFDINSGGQVVGESFTFGEERPFDRGKSRAVIWENGRLRALPGSRAGARGINDKGEVVGWVGNFDAERAAIWKGGTLRNMPRLAAGEICKALDVNTTTQVVGDCGAWNYAEVAFMDVSGFLWQAGRLRNLGSLGWSQANALNDSGQIVGGRYDRATLWENGILRRLSGSSGPSEAYDINEHGEIVGVSSGRPVLWESGKPTLLPGLPGGHGKGEALSINENGQIVGRATTKDGDYRHAVLWTLKP